MATTLTFKDIIDKPLWRPVAPGPTLNAAGHSMACDLRNNEDRHPILFELAGANVLNGYHVKNNDWINTYTPNLTNAPAAGSMALFVPSAGPAGTLAAGWTTTQGALTTALPAAVGINQLANRGDGNQGFKIRITGNSAGSSGKVAEAYIVANSAGTTPTITLSSPLSFTPASGDRYEILSGRVFLYSSTGGAGNFKYWDVATNSVSGNLTTTNMVAGATDAGFLVLDELYVPTTQSPGGGYFGTLTATATTSTTLTGTTSAGDASQKANQWTNYQIRVVQDTATPTSVGQRRLISSHTAANPTVYTISSAWAVTPSSTAQYVIEQCNDLVYFGTTTTTACYTYQAGGWAADASWTSSTVSGSGKLQIPVRPAANAGGMCAWMGFAMTLDSQANARHSAIYLLRGGAVATIDALDIATLSWSTGIGGNAIAYGNSGTTFTTGTCALYDPVGNSGRYAYVSISGGQRFMRFDCLNRTMEPYGYCYYPAGSAVAGQHLMWSVFIDGATKVPFLYQRRQSGTELLELLIQR